MALSELSDATALFSAVRYTLCDTYIDFPQSVNSGKSIQRRKAILRSKGDSGLSYSRIDEIPVSHLTQTENCLKVTLIRQSHLTNCLTAENGFMLLLWWCPFKIQKEKWAGLQFTSTDFLSIVSTPLRIRWTIPLSIVLCPVCGSVQIVASILRLPILSWLWCRDCLTVTFLWYRVTW
jgi:hypothetical protein